MSSGLFFFPDDRNPSIREPKIFRYKGLQIESNNHFSYPIFLSIDQNNISLYFHAPLKDSPDSNFELFSLPLTTNTYKNDLTSTLREIYFEKIDLSFEKTDENGKAEKPVIPFGNDEINKIDSFRKIPEFGFTKLALADLADKENRHDYLVEIYGKAYKLAQTIPEWLAKDNNNKVKLFLRQLFLDFIFDLRHGNVFQESKWLDEALNTLHGNLLFSAIEAKAEYYYCRYSYLESFKESESKTENKDVLILYSEKLLEAERQWLSIIRKEESQDLFSTSNWFNTVETETEAVILWDKNILENSGFKRLGRTGKQLWHAIIKTKYDSREEWIREYQKLLIDKLIKPGNNSHKQNTQEGPETKELQNKFDKIERVSILTTKWFLKRYKIIHAFLSALQLQHIFAKKWPTKIYFLLFILFGISMVGLFGISWPKFFIFLAAGLFLCFALLIIFAFIFFIAYGLLGKKSVKSHLSSYLNILSPRLFVAILSSNLFLLSSEDFWKYSFDFKLLNSGLLLACLSVIVFLFLIVEVKNLARDEQNNLIGRVMVIFVMALVYAISVSTTYISLQSETVISRSEFLKTFFDQKTDPKEVFRISDQNFELFNEEQTKVCTKNSEDSIFRMHESQSIATENIIAYTSLNIMGEQKNNTLLFYSLCCDTRVDGSEFPDRKLIEYVKIGDLRLFALPGMILFTSAIAMFLGVFVQLIFDDKPVTEPL